MFKKKVSERQNVCVYLQMRRPSDFRNFRSLQLWLLQRQGLRLSGTANGSGPSLDYIRFRWLRKLKKYKSLFAAV